ncbi:MAG: hypothetical protein IT298_12295 [Chloroflexi bacterium]|nr:MAG: hypothetical protein UZ13_02689 [Chloroflexi bacterium OLB13]MBC6957361.1 hypothetical protein [Chloroflexota bacterium]MBW7879957.1 hypothetical protein [Anaerolineae bacterium]MDL1916761.1 hypothetical protein [Anaerolineae bacterium CFX4]OQY83929.1 MAG: hypothetical protein B6D42_06375 [Anaerolineae bacterium UTCFX5]
MKLILNGEVMAADAGPDDIKRVIDGLPPNDEAILELQKAEDEFMQAGGVPESGFVLGYVNQPSKIEMVSGNKAVKPRTVAQVFTAYAAGDFRWRGMLAWKPANERVSKEMQREAMRKYGPYVFLMFLAVMAWLPAFQLTRMISEAVVFKPLCLRAHPDFLGYRHGSYPGLTQIIAYGSSGHEPECLFAERPPVPLSAVTDGAAVLDIIMVIAELFVPLFALGILYVVIAVAIHRFRKRRREGLPQAI